MWSESGFFVTDGSQCYTRYRKVRTYATQKPVQRKRYRDETDFEDLFTNVQKKSTSTKSKDFLSERIALKDVTNVKQGKQKAPNYKITKRKGGLLKLKKKNQKADLSKKVTSVSATEKSFVFEAAAPLENTISTDHCTQECQQVEKQSSDHDKSQISDKEHETVEVDFIAFDDMTYPLPSNFADLPITSTPIYSNSILPAATLDIECTPIVNSEKLIKKSEVTTENKLQVRIQPTITHCTCLFTAPHVPIQVVKSNVISHILRIKKSCINAPLDVLIL